MQKELFRVVDPVGFGPSLARAFARLASHPLTTFEPTSRFAGGLLQAYAVTAARMVGVDVEGPLAPSPHDGRFTDEAWSQNPFYYALLQLYLLNDRLVTELLEAAAAPEPDAAKSKFASTLVINAIAPTNYLFTNPKALKRAFDTGGRSLVLGARNYLQDVSTNGGWPSQVRKGRFRVGENMAAEQGASSLSQRPGRADPIRTADSRSPLSPDTVLPALDQQVLHHGPGPREEPCGVGAPAWSHGFPDQLSQPR